MSPETSALECPICIEKFKNPVVTPCGHIICEPCIKQHARLSRHPYEATCPVCRAPFPTVLADLSTIPRKYHIFFASPPLRRVYLGDGEDNSRAVIDDLKLEIANLNARIETLNRDNYESSLKGWLSGASWALDEAKEEKRLALDQANEEARVALDKAREETRIANQSLEELRAEYDALELEFHVMNSSTSMNTKRTSGQAALDHPPSNRVGSSTHGIEQGRPIIPLPKRAKLNTFITSLSPFRFSVPPLDFTHSPTLSGPTGQAGSSSVAAGSNTSRITARSASGIIGLS